MNVDVFSTGKNRGISIAVKIASLGMPLLQQWKCFYNPIISVYGICTYICHENQPNLGKYTNPMNPMRMGNLDCQSHLSYLAVCCRWYWILGYSRKTNECFLKINGWKMYFLSLGIQSYSQMMIGVYNNLLSIVFRFHYHSQKVSRDP